ncbi:hypothetical protein IFM89_013173 [Coptis chinensis]|uniref:Disease resistance protein n=1 Tax=Coptis chinensis TaxID=261450 RepID=A0A835IAK8_9MAGN|nr:hypothetical protein IFM89_013173 [Coptis chinensis]
MRYPVPHLHSLRIWNCRKLKVVPHYMFSQALKNLRIDDCPELGEVQPWLPPLLEELILESNVGAFSKSLPLGGECSSYPNLKSVWIGSSPHSSLPKGFNQLTSIQSLHFYQYETLDFELEELKHLTMLQHLEIKYCPILRKRFRKGMDWRSTLSHVPKITFNRKEITRSRK